MKLKEIEKIIDEADLIIGKKEDEVSNYEAFSMANPLDSHRDGRKQNLIKHLEQGWIMTFYRANFKTMELRQLAKVNHIDEEKKVKVIKKKLDEMTEQEVRAFCFKREGKNCESCPLMFYADKKNKTCLYDYFLLKHSKEMFGDKEIEIEVEK